MYKIKNMKKKQQQQPKQEGKITKGHFGPRKTYDRFLLATRPAERHSTDPTKPAPYHSFVFTSKFFSGSFIAKVEAEDSKTLKKKKKARPIPKN